MTTAHIMAAGMCGIRTAGDLVAWMQLTRRMKIREAKEYVAGKLGVAIEDLANEDAMRQVRGDLDIGAVSGPADLSKGIVAKCRIAELLDIPILGSHCTHSKIAFRRSVKHKLSTAPLQKKGIGRKKEWRNNKATWRRSQAMLKESNGTWLIKR